MWEVHIIFFYYYYKNQIERTNAFLVRFIQTLSLQLKKSMYILYTKGEWIEGKVKKVSLTQLEENFCPYKIVSF
jgi:hypothetical protein